MTRPFESLDPSERKALAGLAIQKARQALQLGERRQARRYAEQAAALAPDREDAWLMLAALASPRASVAYLEQALKINPLSQRARKGMEWAWERLKHPESPPAEPVQPTAKPAGAARPERARATPVTPASPKPAAALAQPAPIPGSAPARTTVYRIRPAARPRRRGAPGVLLFAFGLFFLSLVFIAASFIPYYPQLAADLSPRALAQAPLFSVGVSDLAPTPTAEVLAVEPTHTPEEIVAAAPTNTPPVETPLPPTETPFTVPTDTPTPAPSPTPLPTETPLPTASPTPEPTATLIPSPLPPPTQPPPPPTAVPQPTKKPKQKVVAGPGPRPENVSLNDRWVDVDLSSQTTYAMQGDQVVRNFVVSTGRWPNVTVTGAFKVYVKYRSADMSGEDYYLPNVPYVMYFFKGYGLHGTYWHNNFGTPMSHGCVNLRTDDAAWLFDFASVGTVVSVHQ